MDLGLKGKVALISGGSAGMGREIARELAMEGAKVVIVARREEPLRAVVAEIKAAGGSAAFVAADMTKKADIQRAASHARSVFGDPDIALANVRPANRYSFEDTTDEDFQQSYEAIIMSMVHLVRELSPSMKARKWGRFLSLGSVCMKEPHRFYNLVLSNTFRVGTLGLHRSLSNELAPFGITVNGIAPGHIATEAYNETKAAGVASARPQVEDEPSIPMGRPGSASEIAGLSVFLCSERASYITGQTVSIDGGYTRGLF
jgi:3-oxoacyl-[acyl-carrier protein] reductase